MAPVRPTWVVQFILPPALLTYFGWAWRRCQTSIGKDYLGGSLQLPWASMAYRTATTAFIGTITVTFLRLFFLPRRQCVPPPVPPEDIARLKTAFECTPTARAVRAGYDVVTHDDAQDIIPHCDKCAGRWKPARARHCSECGICRAGFDHHCAFFANCLTAPYIPAFLLLCLLTPLTVSVVSAPVYLPLAHRLRRAWAYASTDSRAQEWWNWTPGWIVPIGPLGRYLVGLSFGWLALDKDDPVPLTLEVAWMIFIAQLLGGMTSGLAYSTLRQVRSGNLTVDYERQRAYARALGDADALARKGREPDDALRARLDRFAPRWWFFVPVDSEEYAGVVLATTTKPYDLGSEANLDLVVRRCRGRWLPWNALKAGMGDEEVMSWPISPVVQAELEAEAARIIGARGSS